jgi:hypothetical protein
MKLTVDIPDELYPRVLRVIADLLDGVEPSAEAATRHHAEAGEAGLSSWQVSGFLPNAWTQDFQLLARLYASVTPQARRLMDELVTAGQAGVHQDQLVAALDLNGTSALAGTVGHITKTAEGLGRMSPIHRDTYRKTYSFRTNLAEALGHARLWACKQILTMDDWGIDEPPRKYVHLFELHGTTYRHVAEHPKRYLMLPRRHLDEDLQPAFIKTLDDLMEAFGEAFDSFETLVLEFAPDEHLEVLRGRPTFGPGDLGRPETTDDEDLYADLKPVPPGLEVDEIS